MNELLTLDILHLCSITRGPHILSILSKWQNSNKAESNTMLHKCNAIYFTSLIVGLKIKMYRVRFLLLVICVRVEQISHFMLPLSAQQERVPGGTKKTEWQQLA